MIGESYYANLDNQLTLADATANHINVFNNESMWMVDALLSQITNSLYNLLPTALQQILNMFLPNLLQMLPGLLDFSQQYGDILGAINLSNKFKSTTPEDRTGLAHTLLMIFNRTVFGSNGRLNLAVTGGMSADLLGNTTGVFMQELLKHLLNIQYSTIDLFSKENKDGIISKIENFLSSVSLLRANGLLDDTLLKLYAAVESTHMNVMKEAALLLLYGDNPDQSVIDNYRGLNKELQDAEIAKGILILLDKEASDRDTIIKNTFKDIQLRRNKGLAAKITGVRFDDTLSMSAVNDIYTGTKMMHYSAPKTFNLLLGSQYSTDDNIKLMSDNVAKLQSTGELSQQLAEFYKDVEKLNLIVNDEVALNEYYSKKTKNSTVTEEQVTEYLKKSKQEKLEILKEAHKLVKTTIQDADPLKYESMKLKTMDDLLDRHKNGQGGRFTGESYGSQSVMDTLYKAAIGDEVHFKTPGVTVNLIAGDNNTSVEQKISNLLNKSTIMHDTGLMDDKSFLSAQQVDKLWQVINDEAAIDAYYQNLDAKYAGSYLGAKNSYADLLKHSPKRALELLEKGRELLQSMPLDLQDAIKKDMLSELQKGIDSGKGSKYTEFKTKDKQAAVYIEKAINGEAAMFRTQETLMDLAAGKYSQDPNIPIEAKRLTVVNANVEGLRRSGNMSRLDGIKYGAATDIYNAVVDEVALLSYYSHRKLIENITDEQIDREIALARPNQGATNADTTAWNLIIGKARQHYYSTTTAQERTNIEKLEIENIYKRTAEHLESRFTGLLLSDTSSIDILKQIYNGEKVLYKPERFSVDLFSKTDAYDTSSKLEVFKNNVDILKKAGKIGDTSDELFKQVIQLGEAVVDEVAVDYVYSKNSNVSLEDKVNSFNLISKDPLLRANFIKEARATYFSEVKDPDLRRKAEALALNGILDRLALGGAAMWTGVKAESTEAAELLKLILNHNTVDVDILGTQVSLFNDSKQTLINSLATMRDNVELLAGANKLSVPNLLFYTAVGDTGNALLEELAVLYHYALNGHKVTLDEVEEFKKSSDTQKADIIKSGMSILQYLSDTVIRDKMLELVTQLKNDEKSTLLFTGKAATDLNVLATLETISRGGLVNVLVALSPINLVLSALPESIDTKLANMHENVDLLVKNNQMTDREAKWYDSVQEFYDELKNEAAVLAYYTLQNGGKDVTDEQVKQWKGDTLTDKQRATIIATGMLILDSSEDNKVSYTNKALEKMDDSTIPSMQFTGKGYADRSVVGAVLHLLNGGTLDFLAFDKFTAQEIQRLTELLLPKFGANMTALSKIFGTSDYSELQGVATELGWGKLVDPNNIDKVRTNLDKAFATATVTNRDIVSVLAEKKELAKFAAVTAGGQNMVSAEHVDELQRIRNQAINNQSLGLIKTEDDVVADFEREYQNNLKYAGNVAAVEGILDQLPNFFDAPTLEKVLLLKQEFHTAVKEGNVTAAELANEELGLILENNGLLSQLILKYGVDHLQSISNEWSGRAAVYLFSDMLQNMQIDGKRKYTEKLVLQLSDALDEGVNGLIGTNAEEWVDLLAATRSESNADDITVMLRKKWGLDESSDKDIRRLVDKVSALDDVLQALLKAYINGGTTHELVGTAVRYRENQAYIDDMFKDDGTIPDSGDFWTNLVAGLFFDDRELTPTKYARAAIKTLRAGNPSLSDASAIDELTKAGGKLEGAKRLGNVDKSGKVDKEFLSNLLNYLDSTGSKLKASDFLIGDTNQDGSGMIDMGKLNAYMSNNLITLSSGEVMTMNSLLLDAIRKESAKLAEFDSVDMLSVRKDGGVTKDNAKALGVTLAENGEDIVSFRYKNIFNKDHEGNEIKTLTLLNAYLHSQLNPNTPGSPTIMDAVADRQNSGKPVVDKIAELLNTAVDHLKSISDSVKKDNSTAEEHKST